jgi:hypothetical protein
MMSTQNQAYNQFAVMIPGGIATGPRRTPGSPVPGRHYPSRDGKGCLVSDRLYRVGRHDP